MMLTNKKSITKTSGAAKRNELIPDFLIIGAGKSGTTSLDCYLKQHPEIFIPNVKEPNFYGYENAKIERFIHDPVELKHFLGSVTSLTSYLALFEDAASGQIKGETSNTYMYHEQAAARIHHYNPDMKLIAVLRQPASRLYSRYLHLAREKRFDEIGSDFSTSLDKNSIWWKRNDLIPEGFYFQHLSRFYRLFPKKNIRIYLYEELNDQPYQVLADIFSFLGVDPGFKADITLKLNQSGFIKNEWLDKIIGQHGLVSATIKAVLPSTILEKVKNNTTVLRVVTLIRDKNLDRPQMNQELKRKLTHEVYGEDIGKLQKLIDKDLTHWLK